jgi:hypothetical protein
MRDHYFLIDGTLNIKKPKEAYYEIQYEGPGKRQVSSNEG